jgi:mono/diheme cytochrome c family protein
LGREEVGFGVAATELLHPFGIAARLLVDGGASRQVMAPVEIIVRSSPATPRKRGMATSILGRIDRQPRIGLSGTHERHAPFSLEMPRSRPMIRFALLASAALALCLASPVACRAAPDRLPIEFLPTPPGATHEQVALGDRIFHGEAAGGRCSKCHGADAKGTGNGNDLTLGMWVWGDGSLRAIKGTILHNMSVAPGMDGELTPADVDAVAAYVWAIGHQKN